MKAVICIAISLVITSGCASSGLKNEFANEERTIARKNNEISSAKRILTNSRAYQGGECSLPEGYSARAVL